MEPLQLPYIDGEVDPQTMAMVHAMVADEMRTFKPKNYLKEFPLPQLKFARSEALQAEYARVSSGHAMEKLDMSRYAVKPPPDALLNDVQAWRRAVVNAKSQVYYVPYFNSPLLSFVVDISFAIITTIC